jgi:hypothetical protein
VRGNRQANTRAERAGFPAAPFGKTPARAGFSECDLPPAEFFFLLFYRVHNREFENVILTLSQYPLFAHTGHS